MGVRILEPLLDEAPFPTALVHADGRIVRENGPWAELSRRVLHTPAEERPLSIADWQAKVASCLAKGAVEFLTPDFGYLCRMKSAHDGIHVWVSVADVGHIDMASRALQAEQVHLKKLEELSEMAAALAHEINNPLTVIVARVQHLRAMMKSGAPFEPRLLQEALDKVAHHAERIFKIVKGIRSFSRDSRHDPMTEAPLAAVIHDSLSLANASIRDLGVRVEIEGLREDMSIRGRPSQLIQVFLNLLQNALFVITDVPFPAIRIEISEGREFYLVAVSDNGPGVPPGYDAKIFAPFFTTKPPGSGTGIGLSVSMRIIHDHGGSLKLDRGRGASCFVVQIPKGGGSP